MLVWETLPAMIVGVLLSLAFLVRRASFPHVVEVRRTADGLYREFTPQVVDTSSRGSAPQMPGLPDAPSASDASDAPDVPDTTDASDAVIRFEASLLYANAIRLERAIHTLRAERPDLRRLVLDAEMISDLDSDGAEMLTRVDEQLGQAGIELRLARVHRYARLQMRRSGLDQRFEGRMFSHVIEALES